MPGLDARRELRSLSNATKFEANQVALRATLEINSQTQGQTDIDVGAAAGRDA